MVFYYENKKSSLWIINTFQNIYYLQVTISVCFFPTECSIVNISELFKMFTSVKNPHHCLHAEVYVQNSCIKMQSLNIHIYWNLYLSYISWMHKLSWNYYFPTQNIFLYIIRSIVSRFPWTKRSNCGIELNWMMKLLVRQHVRDWPTKIILNSLQ